MQKILSKNKLHEFIKNLMEKYQVIAPVNKQPTQFEIITDPNQIALNRITLIPPKKFFLPENETILEFKNQKIIEPKIETKPRIIFGLRKCDLNALKILDEVMHDPLYINKRKKTITIGIFCEHPDKYCFCNSMELIEYYDLFFYLHKNNYYISIGSKKRRSC